MLHLIISAEQFLELADVCDSHSGQHALDGLLCHSQGPQLLTYLCPITNKLSHLIPSTTDNLSPYPSISRHIHIKLKS